MEKKKLEQLLAEAKQKLIELQRKFDSASEEYEASVEHDFRRTDGSERQDRLHEQHMQNVRDRYDSALGALQKQKAIVADLENQLNQ